MAHNVNKYDTAWTAEPLGFIWRNRFGGEHVPL